MAQDIHGIWPKFGEFLRQSRPFLERLALGAACLSAAIGQTPSPGPRALPARTIPVPETVSPQMQKLIAAPLPPTWNVIPKTAAEWKAQVDEGAAAAVKALPALRQRLHV